jgi:uncharacterized membrane protein
MLRIEYFYWLIGALLVVAAVRDLRRGHRAMALFWGVLACPFLFGDLVIAADAAGSHWPAQAMGAGVIVLGLMASRSGMRSTGDDDAARARRERSARHLGNRLFLPALAIPVVTLVLVLATAHLHWGAATLLAPAHATLTALGVACVVALAAAMRVTGEALPRALGEGCRLLDALGWAALLPMLLATLGAVFAATGVGDAVAAIAGSLIPVDSRLACLLAFATGMVAFTVVMGNAFAAFPVMMAGIGLPLLIHRHGADPAVLGSIGMLTGYCGTLFTPMAANFNVVPVALLELPDQYAVIRAQLPTGLALLLVNVSLLWFLAFR